MHCGFRALLVLGLLTGPAFLLPLWADPPPAGGELKIASKKEAAPAIPDFAKAYGLPFESNQTLGLRLLGTRQKQEPIGLALIAAELAANEQASGKKAEVT